MLDSGTAAPSVQDGGVTRSRNTAAGGVGNDLSRPPRRAVVSRPRAIVGTSLCAPFAVAAIVGFTVTYNIKLLIIAVICVLGVLNLAGGAMSRRLALRVDADGITLGGRGRSSASSVNWDQVQTVMLYQPRNIGMIGVVKSYAVVPAEPMNPGLPDSPPTPDLSMALDSWRVDFARLKQVIGEVAPAVDVLDRR